MNARLFERHARYIFESKGRIHLVLSGLSILLLGFLLVGPASAAAAQEEPSPIEIELSVPQQAGPNEIIDVLIRYNVTDLNAGAVLNYNLFGPGRIWTRTPEPPNPIVNTWGPKFDPVQGSVKIQVQIEQGTEGQQLQHQVEVKWGSKFARFEAITQIEYVPPTATPTQPPRPTVVPTATTTPPSPAQPTWNLVEAAFVSPEDGTELSSAAPNQEVALDIRYTGSQDVTVVEVQIQFEPDVVNLDGAERTDSGYVLQLANVPAAGGEGELLFDPPLRGRIRFYAEGQQAYTLQALVQASIPDDPVSVDVAQVETASLEVNQPPAEAGMITVQANTDSQTIRVGGNVIVHARCTNSAPVPVSNVRLYVAGLSDRFSIVPNEHVIDTVAAGETAERVFTIRAPDDLQGSLSFRIAATVNDQTIESEPVSVEVTKPAELGIQLSADKTMVRAGDASHLNVTIENTGDRVVEDTSVRLIDVTGNLGVLLQTIESLAPGETRDLLFAVQVPEDFPADIVSSMVVQVVAADGTIVESAPLSLTVVCVPDLQLVAQAPAETLRAGESAEIVVTVRNVSQCTARDIVVGVGGLPASFTPPPEVRIAELGPGESRQLTVSLLVPDRQSQGGINVVVTAADSAGTQEVAQAGFLVGGVSVFFTVVFALLVLLALGAIVVGTVLYFRQR